MMATVPRPASGSSRAARSWMGRFIVFASFGAMGTVVDMGVFAATFAGMTASPYLARALSFCVSVAVIWYVHRVVTFKTRGAPDALGELRRFFTVNLVGFVANLAAFTVAIETSALLAALPVLAIAVGALAALAINFMLADKWAFRSLGRAPVSDDNP
jgi:putative flippase GtrA